MSLANEAAYLYVLSKDFVRVNKEIQILSKKAQKHLEDHARAVSSSEKEKHRHKHSKRVSKIRKLMEKHDAILTKLRHHQIAFAHQLQKEHRIQ
ncbi:hypothetical protein HY496_03005 [Candidatus Woesearchaeota archaeon]|nr:hypothetical protein [Candidatus Woesearchaeota archaeon]